MTESNETIDNEDAMNDFEFGSEHVPFEIEVRGKKAAYLLKDITADEADKLFAPITQGSDLDKKKAQLKFRNRVIAAVVLRADGRPITEDEAKRLRTPVAVKLAAAAMDFLNVDEVEAKNDSAES